MQLAGGFGRFWLVLFFYNGSFFVARVEGGIVSETLW